ncbi:MAG: hypothetical protein ACREUL_20100 [Steroidobacteraceae bacterium]
MKRVENTLSNETAGRCVMNARTSHDSRQSGIAPPIGRVLRGLLGLWCLYVVAANVRSASWELALALVTIVMSFVVLYSALHFLVVRYLRRLNRWVGAVLAVLPAAVVFLLGNDATKLGALLFFGLSLTLAGIRGDPGCEVMSIPALLFRRRTRLVCLLFSPLDWLEDTIYRLLGNRNYAVPKDRP